jgi:preprotein translocase subunit YajC
LGLTLTLSDPTLIASVAGLSLFFWPILLGADPATGGGAFGFLLIFGPLFAIWYFLVIRPQQTQRRKVQDMLSNLKTGDRVLTTGGIYGTVVGFRDSVVQLQVAQQVRLEVARSAISSLASPEGESKADAAAGREPAAKEAAARGKK